MSDPEVSVVIPSYGSSATLPRTLESLAAQSVVDRPELLVVDSSESDPTEKLARRFPDVRVVRSTRRLSPGAARNLGVRQSRGRVVAFLDADIVAPSDWLGTLRKRLDADPDISAVGAAVANANPEVLAGRVLYWIEFSEFLPGFPSGFRKRLSSSNLVLRRETFLEVGGFDESWAMGEDLLFCEKVQKGLFFEGTVAVLHRHRTEWRQVRDHLFNLGLWSGRLRRSGRQSGSRLVSAPLLSTLLPAYRAPVILWRLLRSSPRECFTALTRLPWLLYGLTIWTRGFYRGLTGVFSELRP